MSQVHLSDLFPTLLAAAGVPVPEDTGPFPLDGMSFWAAATQQLPGPRNELLHQPVNEFWNASCWACDLVDLVTLTRAGRSGADAGCLVSVAPPVRPPVRRGASAWCLRLPVKVNKTLPCESQKNTSL